MSKFMLLMVMSLSFDVCVDGKVAISSFVSVSNGKFSLLFISELSYLSKGGGLSLQELKKRKKIFMEEMHVNCYLYIYVCGLGGSLISDGSFSIVKSWSRVALNFGFYTLKQVLSSLLNNGINNVPMLIIMKLFAFTYDFRKKKNDCENMKDRTVDHIDNN